MNHCLKIWPGNFEAVAKGEKLHEVRSSKDREFNKGDTVILEEWTPDDAKALGESDIEITKGHYTGRRLFRKITNITKGGTWGLPPDLCAFSISK